MGDLILEEWKLFKEELTENIKKSNVDVETINLMLRMLENSKTRVRKSKATDYKE